jgi:hypothetical protein
MAGIGGLDRIGGEETDGVGELTAGGSGHVGDGQKTAQATPGTRIVPSRPVPVK